MRKYKFRGKSKRDGEWFYGNLYDKDTKGNTHICTLEKGCLVIDPDTVGQFTGMCDKKGREIYEGDIVEMHDPYNVYRSDYTGIVEWIKCRWMIRRYILGFWDYGDLMFDDFANIKLTVIGNIHDDIELKEKVLSQGDK